MKKKLLYLIISLLLPLQLLAVDEVKYPYIIVLQPGDRMEMNDSLFYRIARRVKFPVNSYVIPQESDFRHELLDKVAPYMRRNNLLLQGVIIRGSASPEGPIKWNIELGKRRTRALAAILEGSGELPVSNDIQTSIEVATDYDFLLMMMQEANDTDYNRVSQLVKRYYPSDTETLRQKLMAIDNGQLWHRLLAQYFPDLRASRIVLFFGKRMEKTAPVTVQAEPASVVELRLEPLKMEMPVDSVYPRRELLAVKTNLLFDFAWMPGYDKWCPIPNVAIEYFPLHGHWTYGASIDFPWHQDYWGHKYFQVRNYQVEARRYFKTGDVNVRGYGNGAAYRGWYVSGYAHAAIYGLCFDENRGWMGEGFGGGVGFGYVLPLSKKGHWKLEAGMQLGYFWTKYDPFQYECPVDPTEQDHLYYYKWTLDASLFRKRQYRYSWLGPTRIGVSLSYDLLYRRRGKKGVSFIPYTIGTRENRELIEAAENAALKQNKQKESKKNKKSKKENKED